MKRFFEFSILLLICGCGIKPQAETWEARKLRTINALKKYKGYGYEKKLIAVQAFAQTDEPRLCQAFVVQNGAPGKYLLIVYWIADVPNERAISIVIKNGPAKMIPFEEIVIEAYKKNARSTVIHNATVDEKEYPELKQLYEKGGTVSLLNSGHKFEVEVDQEDPTPAK